MPMPASAVTTDSPSRMPRTRMEKATSAARLSMLVLDARRRDHAEPSRHNLKGPWNLAGDLAVEGDIHRLSRPHAQARDLERAQAADPAPHAKDWIECRAQQPPDRQGLDHDDVEGPVVQVCTRKLEVEKSPKDRGVDHREMDEAQQLGSPFGLDLAPEDRPFLHGDRHRDRVGQPPEARSHVSSRREARELDVEARRRGVDEIARWLIIAGQLARVVARNLAASK